MAGTRARGTRVGDIWLRDLERWVEWVLDQMPTMSVEQHVEVARILRDMEIQVMDREEK